MANVLMTKTREIKEGAARFDGLKQTNAKIKAELSKWSQASSYFEENQIKLESEIHKVRLLLLGY